MAWISKYYSEWTDREGYEHRLEFRIDGDPVSEDPTEITVSEFSTNYPEIEFFGEGVVYSAGADIKIITETPLKYLNDFYVVDPKGMQIRHIIYDYPGFPEVYYEFIGFLDTEQFEDPISNGVNYEISLTANNGIPVLNRMSMVDSNGDNYTGLMKVADLLQIIFDKLNLGYTDFNFGITSWIAPNPLPSSLSDTVYRGEIFHNLYILTDNFYDEKNNAMSCREALEEILKSFTAKLYIFGYRIYIVDIRSLLKEQLSAKRYSFSSLDYLGNINISNHKQIDRRLEEHSVSIAPGKNKVSINFNKYSYSNPLECSFSDEDLSDYIRTDDFLENGNLKYREIIYGKAEGFRKLNNPDETEFVRRLSGQDNSESGEYFIRLKPPPEDETFGSYRLQINTGIYITSAYQFLGMDAQIMYENPDNYGVVDDIRSEPVTYGQPFHFYFGLQDTKNGNSFPPNEPTVNYFFTKMTPYRDYDHAWNRSLAVYYGWRYDLDSDNWVYYFMPLNAQVVTYGTNIKFNQWYNLNGGVNFLTHWPVAGSNPYKVFPSIVVPLNNPVQYTSSTNISGYLYVTIFIPKRGTTPAFDSYYYNFRGLLLKNLKIYLLKENEATSIEKYDKFESVENNDVEFEGRSDPNYIESVEIPTKQGSDTSSFSRGAYFIRVTGNYYDSMATNERYVRAEKFIRGQNSGLLEKLFVNTYLSNLERSRFILTVNLEGYYLPFQKFSFEMLKRDDTPVFLIPVSINVDHKNCSTSFRLLEVTEEKDI